MKKQNKFMPNKNLNPSQQKAARHTDGPLLIVAGAGTGKTTVLVERLDYLIKNNLAKADEILITTFTEKAAGELEERADKILPYGYVELWINTFHGFCERILREHAIEIGLPGNFEILSQTQSWVLLRKNLAKFDLDYYKPLGNPTKFIHELLKHFSRLKDENISSKKYLEYAENLKLDTDRSISEDYQIEIKRINELANAYHAYNQLLLDNSFLDFGDLIFYTIKLFKERPNILEHYRDKFKFVMVDEFQDTNWAQYELVKMLTAPKNNLMAIGDDDQCLPGDSLVMTKNGEKRIDQIKKGDIVATAVGKGYLSYSQVNHVNKSYKKAKLISFITKKGFKITVTDNHKMFCFVPPSQNYYKDRKYQKYYYVYLMHKKEIGWRLGISRDLAVRLKLERTADRIVAIEAFKTEEEARYRETFLSLKYGIPTVCFTERDGIMTKNIWVEKLYQELDVLKSAQKLAKDLGVNLEAHQVCLEAVNRGSKVRIKINLEMCYRNYRSKYAKNGFLQKPEIAHMLSLDTSHRETIRKLKKMGFHLTKSKKGQRLRISGMNLEFLGKIALKIQKATGALIENKMRIGTTNKQHKKTLVVEASNVLQGMFMPVVSPKGIIYDQIIDRTEEIKKINVYDLEIDQTHNFIANGVAVHNSIYKFRGASISNIMQFKDDYPKAKEIVLTQNYRSGQVVLDSAYKFIKNNNPNRLEVKLGIDKKLQAIKNEPGLVEHFQFLRERDEIAGVSSKIKQIKASNREINWKDFAILVRANSTADAYVAELTREAIPNQFVSLRGLYYKPIILDCLAYFKLLDNYHESSAIFRALGMDIFKVAHKDIIEISKFARRKVWSLFEALRHIQAIPGIEPESIASVNKLLNLVNKHSSLAQEKNATEVFINFVYDSGLIKNLDQDRDRELFSYLNQIYEKMKKFEATDASLKLKDFLDLIELETEAGETGALRLDFEDDDTVKIMTVHSAKGLEFDYVFMPSLVDKRFPTISRRDKITIPDELVREQLPVGDIHIEEERRLFYVAMTRAKKALYLSSAKDYGGAREKKVSKFVEEAELSQKSIKSIKSKVVDSELLSDLERFKNGVHAPVVEKQIALPTRFSFSQLAAYENCPLQYKFNFILKIPVPSKASLQFGRVMHNSLKDFLTPLLAGTITQASLFGGDIETEKNKEKLTLKNLLEIYEKNWINDGYESKEERDQYKKKGRDILKDFWQKHDKEGWPEVLALEKAFVLKLDRYLLRGAIDRIDKMPDGKLEIIDYKTGNPKEKLGLADKRQLILYKIAVEEIFGQKASKLTYYYLENNTSASFEAKDQEVENLKQKIKDQIEEIKKCQFLPKPSMLCGYCDFRGICEFRAK